MLCPAPSPDAVPAVAWLDHQPLVSPTPKQLNSPRPTFLVPPNPAMYPGSDDVFIVGHDLDAPQNFVLSEQQTLDPYYYYPDSVAIASPGSAIASSPTVIKTEPLDWYFDHSLDSPASVQQSSPVQMPIVAIDVPYKSYALEGAVYPAPPTLTIKVPSPEPNLNLLFSLSPASESGESSIPDTWESPGSASEATPTPPSSPATPRPLPIVHPVVKPRGRIQGTHTEGERNFRCQVCSVGFFRKHDLARHARSHTGEKPFPCLGGCGKTFRRADARGRHWRLNPLCDNAHTAAIAGTADGLRRERRKVRRLERARLERMGASPAYIEKFLRSL